MINYPMQDTKGLPLYEYLYRCIREDIAAGRLEAGCKLPSKRSLAQQLGVSVVTVQNAYAQLVAEGYVYTMEKRGYFVSTVDGTLPPPAPIAPAVLEEKAAPYFLDLTSNYVAASCFPFSVWSKLMRCTLSEMGKALLQPVPSSGVKPLREAIARYLGRMRGMRVSPEQVIIGAGAEYLYILLIQLLGHDKIFAVEDPCYPKTPKIYTANGVRCAHIELDTGGVSMAALENSGAQVLHISPSHHFPTGLVTGIQRRQELLRWAEEREERYMIEDDYDCEFRFSGRPIPAMQSIDKNGRVLYMNTFAKSMMPSMRIGYVVLPPQLMARFQERLGFYACTVPSMEQYTLARFIEEGHFERHIARTKNLYRGHRNRVIEAIKESPFGPISTICEEDAGLHFLLKLDSKRSDAELVSLAAAKGIKLSCLTEYMHVPDERYAHQVVVNYSSIDWEKLPETFRRLAEAFGY